MATLPQGDTWLVFDLPSGRCVSKWEPLYLRKTKNGCVYVLEDIDSIDLNGDGQVTWPGGHHNLWRDYYGPGGEAFPGTDERDLTTVGNFKVLTGIPGTNAVNYHTEHLGPGVHGEQ